MQHKKNWNTFRNILEVIVTSSKDTSKIDDKYVKITRFFRTLYMFLLIFVYGLSLSSVAATAEFLTSYPWMKVLFAINELLVLILTLADFSFWLIISYKGKRPLWNVIKFPFSFVGLLLLLIAVPAINQIAVLSGLNSAQGWVLRYLALIRILRLFMLLQFFRPFAALFNVFKKEKVVLFYTFIFIIFIILIFSIIFYTEEVDKATGIFMKKDGQLEPDGNQFLKAIYFTTVTMTTIGYGDLTPATQTGKIMVIVLSIISIGIFAIPSGVIAGGFISELKSQIDTKNDKNNDPHNK
ncbi:potassium channel family protein [Mycoplasma simbae]|uniref:potassium channel family protein n=1 Tax=Mycoplasma simbae TaxID=36744 RepID=UPI000497ACF1|nr:potassium channel family protein [Mycoplasma simbae]